MFCTTRLTLILGLAAVAAPAFADTVIVGDTEFVGRVEEKGDKIVLYMKGGGHMTFPRSTVQKIIRSEETAPSPAEPEEPRDAEIRKLREENELLRGTIRRQYAQIRAMKVRIRTLEKRLQNKGESSPSASKKSPSPPKSRKKDKAPAERDQVRDKYEFTPLTSVKFSPKFQLGASVSMGDWSYKAYRVTEKDKGTSHLAIELHIEIQPEGVSLAPLFLEVQAKNTSNRIVGTGALFAKRVGVMEKLPYDGLILLESLDVSTIVIRKSM